VQSAYVRDLRGVIEREDAQIGVLICMEAPTKPMLKEAAEAGFYKPPGLEDRYPRIQVLTIEELLAGKGVVYPRLLEVAERTPRRFMVGIGCVGVFRLRGCFASRSSHFAQDDSVWIAEESPSASLRAGPRHKV
jgi:hypothetical protein